MLVRKKITIAYLMVLVGGLIVPRIASPALAEGLLTDQTFHQNEAALLGVQAVAPLNPITDDYNYVRSAGLSIEPEILTNVAVGQTFSVKLMVDPGESIINTVKASLSYSPETLKLVAVDGEGTPFSMIFDEQSALGEVAVTAMQPAPGISVKAQIVQVYFVATSIGEAKIDFMPTSMVLANDGHGSDVLATARGVSLPVVGNY